MLNPIILQAGIKKPPVKRRTLTRELHDVHLPEALRTPGLKITSKTGRTGITMKRMKSGLTPQQVLLSSHHKDIRSLEGYAIPDAIALVTCSLAMAALNHNPIPTIQNLLRPPISTMLNMRKHFPLPFLPPSPPYLLPICRQ